MNRVYRDFGGQVPQRSPPFRYLFSSSFLGNLAKYPAVRQGVNKIPNQSSRSTKEGDKTERLGDRWKRLTSSNEISL